MPISAGTRFGSYEIAGLIGAGGMGEVYRARDPALGRDVALKVLPASFTSDANRVARFEQEAKTLASLNHTNIGHIYGLERSGGTTGLVMELIEGPTLAERLAHGRVPVDEALKIATQLADALEAAHERGIVHRDLKPANIKVRSDGTVKVLDFGIAKALDVRQASGAAALTTPAMTEAGLILGTAAYMSPEQAKGKAVDERTDIWAFGCVLYEMLTGKPAFLGEDVTSTLARVLERDADMSKLPSTVAPAVRRTLELCLEKDTRKRLRHAADVRLALAGGFVLGAPVQSLWRRALPFAATLVLGLLIASTYFVTIQSPTEPAPPEATRPVSRFVITPPAAAPLASLGGGAVVISPDGKRIAYVAEKPENGNIELYVRELDALEPKLIPGTEGQRVDNMNLFFSPDGKTIGYFAPDRGGVVSVTIDGRPRTRILESPWSDFFVGAAWTSDDTIVFSAGSRLMRVSASSGDTPEPLMPERQRTIGRPTVLPGGRGILFRSIEDGRNLVNVLDLETGEEKTILEGGATPRYAASGHIVFAQGTTLMAVPFSASELAITGEPVALLEGVRSTPGGTTHFDLSATGTLVYEAVSDDSDFSAPVWVDEKGAVISPALSDRVSGPRDPRLSPDGKRLLLVTGLGNDGDLWSYDLGGQPGIPLALPGDNHSPVWSPDSRQVAFARSGGGSELFVVPADGNALTPQSLPGPLPVAVPSIWSDAGELILTTRRRINPDIVAIPASAAGEIRPLVASQYAEFLPALSPNGRWLAYVSDRTGTREIWVQRYPDGVPVRVSSNGGNEPQWSRDGRRLFYWQDNAMMAAVVKTDGEFSVEERKQLFSSRYTSLFGNDARTYDVAPDGRFLMILPRAESNAPSSRTIVVVENFDEELRERVRPNAK